MFSKPLLSESSNTAQPILQFGSFTILKTKNLKFMSAVDWFKIYNAIL